MVNIIALFALFSGVISTIAFARNIGGSVKSISFFILGLSVLLLSMPYFSTTHEDLQAAFLPVLLISILSGLFFIGEITKNKSHIAWNLIPVLSVGALFFIQDSGSYSFLESGTDGPVEILLVAALSAITPFLTHLAKLGISNLIIRFGSIRWADNEDNYLESMVSYAFIGGISALGIFLTGYTGLLVAATFYTGASLIARNKLGLKNDTILSAGGALFLLSAMLILIDYSGFNSLDFTMGEVLQGAFVGGFVLLIYDLLLLLARHNKGYWKAILAAKAILIPIIAVFMLAFAYTQLERLGGMLSVAALLFSFALISIIFSLFKDYTFIGLQLIVLGFSFLIAPHFRPVVIESSIDLSALGIQQQDEEESVSSIDIKEAIGEWVIDPENSKVLFELGPAKGRTKGEITDISGSLSIDNNPSSSNADLTLKVASLTTYIPDRDEHLMEKDYFDEPTYPEMRYVANTLSQQGGKNIFQGSFTMMGVSHPLDVTIQVLGIGERDGNEVLVITGSSKIDRTQFGQKSSAKIGDIVDFNYEVQLRRK
jgi:polyisoprenoid-binding protein YceI